MYLIEDVRFHSLSPFRFTGNRHPAKKNLDQLSRRFDSALLSRLADLTTANSLSFDWLSLALDLLSKTHSDAHRIVAAHLRSDDDDDPLCAYLEDSIQLLDLCNSIASEIERLRHGRLSLRFALHLIASKSEPSSLVGAKSSLSEWNASSASANRKNLEIRTGLIRDLARRLEDPPRGRVSTAGKLVRRTIYAAEAIAVFVAGAVVAALTGTAPAPMVKVPSEFAWAEAFNGLTAAVSGEFAKGFVGDVERLESRVKSVCEVLVRDGDGDGDLTGGDGAVAVSETERLEKKLDREVTELKTVTEAFSDGLDRLFNGVNELFHAVLWTRNSVLEKYRVGPQKKIGKLSCK